MLASIKLILSRYPPVHFFYHVLFIDSQTTIALLSVVFFVLWSLVLVICIFTFRVVQVLSLRKKSNDFPHNTPHGPGKIPNSSR